MKPRDPVTSLDQFRKKINSYKSQSNGSNKFHRPITQEKGSILLDDVSEYIQRFVSFPDQNTLIAVTLWAAHTHMVEYFHTSPRLALLSPEPASGKTRVLEILETLVPQPMLCLSPSPATIFRKLSAKKVTLLLDECDTIFTKKGKEDTNEDLRAVLNSGYKRGATIPRCVGPKHEVIDFSVYCATAMAGLGELPNTIMSRSVIIHMRPPSPGERAEPFRSRLHQEIGSRLSNRLAAWARDVGKMAGNAWPELPDGIVDRLAEVWEPLIAVADAAGEHWPELARQSCRSLSSMARDTRVSLGLRLLADLRTIFADDDVLHTETILERLGNGEQFGLDADAPWHDLYGKPINSRKLASMLKPYKIMPQKVRIGNAALQGYRRESMWDAWVRYLPSLEPAIADHLEQKSITGSNGANFGDEKKQIESRQNKEMSKNNSSDPDDPDVPDDQVTEDE